MDAVVIFLPFLVLACFALIMLGVIADHLGRIARALDPEPMDLTTFVSAFEPQPQVGTQPPPPRRPGTPGVEPRP